MVGCILCPFCQSEYIFWDVAVNSKEGKVSDEYPCPTCNAKLTKKNCTRVYLPSINNSINENILQAKQVPVLINYSAKIKKNGKWKEERLTKKPDNDDLELIKRIDSMDIPYWFPTDRLPQGYNTVQPKRSHGLSHVHHFYTKRNLWCLSAFLVMIKVKEAYHLLFMLTSIINRSTQMNRIHLKNFFFGGGGWNAGYLKGTLYISSLPIETAIFEQISSRIGSITNALKALNNSTYSTTSHIETVSVSKLSAKSNSVDYIFTDPPFGSNIMYSELNFIWEAWLKVFTSNIKEAIINPAQSKSVDHYRDLMLSAFKEYYRVLKPKRWLTVEFNNSSSAIWNLIQETLGKSGFIIAQVSVLDKKQGSFKQVTSPNSVKSDLVVSAYKPNRFFETHFLKSVGKGLEAEYIEQFLQQLSIRPAIERTEKMLFSKMVSFYLQHSFEINMNAKMFFEMLKASFIEQDGFWFTANQINSFLEHKKSTGLENMNELNGGSSWLFISDEKSSIIWLYNYLSSAKSFSEISIAYNQIANIYNDSIPELKEILEQNFIYENGIYRRPKSDPEHNQSSEKRERVLEREFETLLIKAKHDRNKIKIVRKEALALGFELCYKEKRFSDILIIAKKLDRSILENSTEINNFVEAAEIMVQGVA